MISQWLIFPFCLRMTDADKSVLRISPEVVSTMTSHHQQQQPPPRCHDNCRPAGRRRAAVHGAETTAEPCSPAAAASVRYPIRPLDETGSGGGDGHVTRGDDDVMRLTTVHRRRRRTAFTSDQVSLDCAQPSQVYCRLQ